MKRMVLVGLLITAAMPAAADVVAEVEAELLKALATEQQAFLNGDCDTVLRFFAEDVSFLANGRPMSREQIGRFCRTIPRPFGDGRAPRDERISAVALGEEAGYTVRDFRWSGPDGKPFREFVTKVWRRIDGGWKIVHFQSDVVPQGPPGD